MPRGVDHGLGGKESENSRRKRAKKGQRIKRKAEAGMKVTNGKKEVVFDEAARVEYLTGFRKRKNERRKFGLAMQIMKETRERKEAVKARKSDILKANNAERDKLLERGGALMKYGDSSSEGEDDDDEGSNGNGNNKKEESVFTDDNTTSMFGGSVSVIVNSGVDIKEDEDGEDRGGVDAEDDQELRKARERLEKKREARMGKPLTKLERALKKVTSSGGMLKKKKKTGASKGGSKDSSSFGRNKKKAEGSAAGKALLHRAMGSGIVGGFKGKGKKKGKR